MIAPSTVWFSYDTKIGKDVIPRAERVLRAGGYGRRRRYDPRQLAHRGHADRERRDHRAVRATPAGHGHRRRRPRRQLRRGEERDHRRGRPRPITSAYLGDAISGARTNIGAGTITCNYDGFDKHRTTIRRGRVRRVEYGAGRAGPVGGRRKHRGRECHHARPWRRRAGRWRGRGRRTSRAGRGGTATARRREEEGEGDVRHLLSPEGRGRVCLMSGAKLGKPGEGRCASSGSGHPPSLRRASSLRSQGAKPSPHWGERDRRRPVAGLSISTTSYEFEFSTA